MEELEYEDLALEDQAPIDVQTSVADAGAWTKKLHITVPAAAVGKAFDTLVGELAGNIRLPGFRPGKVPRGYAEKLFGPDLKQRVTATLVSRAFQSAVRKESLDVVGKPEIDTRAIHAERGKDLSFEMEVEVKPTFELSNYKGLPVEQEEVEIFPEEIDAQIEKIRLRLSQEGDAPEGAALEERDIAFGALRFVVDGAEILKEEEHPLLLIEGHVLGAYAHLDLKFLLGAKVGEKRGSEATLQDNFPLEAFRGKKAALGFELRKIRRPQLPPLDDELGRKAGAPDLAGLREKISTALRAQVNDEVQAKVRQELIDRVVGATSFEVPKRLLGTFGERMALDQRQLLQRMGLDPENVHEPELKKSLAGDAERRIREYFVLDAIAKKEGLEVGEEEVDAEIVRLARSRGVRAADLFAKLEETGGLAQLKAGLKVKQVVDHLLEQAEIKVVPRKKPEPAGCGHAEHEH